MIPPSLPMISAVDRPMPRPAPVIKATRSWNLILSSLAEPVDLITRDVAHLAGVRRWPALPSFQNLAPACQGPRRRRSPPASVPAIRTEAARVSPASSLCANGNAGGAAHRVPSVREADEDAVRGWNEGDVAGRGGEDREGRRGSGGDDGRN